MFVLLLHMSISFAMPKGFLDGLNSHHDALDGARQLLSDSYLYCICIPLLAVVSVEAIITAVQPLHLAHAPLNYTQGQVMYYYGIFGFSSLLANFFYPWVLVLLFSFVGAAWMPSCSKQIILGHGIMIAGIILTFATSWLAPDNPGKMLAQGNSLIGISLAPVRIGVFELLSTLVKYRGLKSYGFAMAVLDMTSCGAYMVGPLFASIFSRNYTAMAIGAAIIMVFTSLTALHCAEVEDYRSKTIDEAIQKFLLEEDERLRIEVAAELKSGEPLVEKEEKTRTKEEEKGKDNDRDGDAWEATLAQ